MTTPNQILRVAGRVVVALSLALTALVFADANPAFGAYGDNDPGPDVEVESETPYVAPSTTTTTAAPVTVPTSDPQVNDAGDSQTAVPVPAENPVVPEAGDAPAPLTLSTTEPAPAAMLPRTGPGTIGEEVALGLGLVAAGLAATAASRRRRSGAQA